MPTVTLYYEIAKCGSYGNEPDSDLSRTESRIESIRKSSQAANQYGNRVFTGWTYFKPDSDQPELALLGIEIHSQPKHLKQTLDDAINHPLQPDYVSCRATKRQQRVQAYTTINKVLEKHRKTVQSEDSQANQILAVVDL